MIETTETNLSNQREKIIKDVTDEGIRHMARIEDLKEQYNKLTKEDNIKAYEAV